MSSFLLSTLDSSQHIIKAIEVVVCVVCLIAKSCPTLCDPMDSSPPGSSVHGIFQARILEWVAISFPRGIFLTQGSNRHLLHSRWILYCQATKEAPIEMGAIIKFFRPTGPFENPPSPSYLEAGPHLTMNQRRHPVFKALLRRRVWPPVVSPCAAGAALSRNSDWTEPQPPCAMV